MEADEQAWEQAAQAHDEARELLEADRVPEAEARATLALDALSAAVGADHPDTANALVTLAEIRMRRGQLVEAVALLEDALGRCAPWLGEEQVDPVRWRAALSLAEALVRLARFARAAETLDALDAEVGPDHPLRGETANLRGVSCRFQGRWDEAEAHYQRALEGLHGVERLPLLHNLSGLASARGDYVAAERWSRAALEAQGRRRTRQYGTDLAGLGDALAGQGRHGEAARHYTRAIALFQSKDGEDPEIAYALHNRGDVQAALGRGPEAEADYLESLSRKHRIFGDVHPEIAATLSNLAALYLELGRPDEARERSRQALAQVGELPAGHPVRVGVESLARSAAKA